MVFPRSLTVSGTGWLDGLYSIGEDARGYPTWWADESKAIFTDKHGAWGITDGGWHSVDASESCVASGDGDVHSHFGTPPQQIICWMIFSNGNWIQNKTCTVTSSDTYTDFHDPALVSPPRTQPLRSPSPPRDPDPSLLQEIVTLQQKVHQLEAANQSYQKYSTHTETESLRQRISQLEAEQSLRRTEIKSLHAPSTTSISALYGKADPSFKIGSTDRSLGEKKMSSDYAKIPTGSVRTPVAASDAELNSVKQRIQKLEQQATLSNQSSVVSSTLGGKKTSYKSPSPPDAVSVTSSKHSQFDNDILHKPRRTPSPPETTPQEANIDPPAPAPSNPKTPSVPAAGVPVSAAAEVPFFTKSVRNSLSSMRTPGRSNNHDPENDAARFDTPTSRVRYSPSVLVNQTPPAVPISALPASAISTPGKRSKGRRSRSRSHSRSRSRSRSRSPGGGTRRTPKRSHPLQGSVKSPMPSPILEAARELRRSASPLDLLESTPQVVPSVQSRGSKRRSRSRSPRKHTVTHGFYEVYRHDRSTAVPITMRTTTPFVGLLASRGMQGYTKYLSDVELWSNMTGVINVDSTPGETSIIGTEEHPVQLFFRMKQPKNASSPMRPLIKIPVNSGDAVSPDRSPLGSVKSPANVTSTGPNDFFDASENRASTRSVNQSFYSTHPSVRGRSRKVTSPR